MCFVHTLATILPCVQLSTGPLRKKRCQEKLLEIKKRTREMENRRASRVAHMSVPTRRPLILVCACACLHIAPEWSGWYSETCIKRPPWAKKKWSLNRGGLLMEVKMYGKATIGT